ncbi:MAG: hypothetical protein HYW89_04130 [Candidatus Sungiibacteriota bacterium]|uniref:Uncharacterized protein n=1 Tax=Candidatus Sungiibacteriota bacterium TaxID=2750080 RepID=A0A7T5RJ78_9BACT|nr:MAG: hypothetical protein HYW89_04130 [Candidatus Sungbacteria bacterium]
MAKKVQAAQSKPVVKPSQQVSAGGGPMGKFAMKGAVVFGGALNPTHWREEILRRGATILEEGEGWLSYGIA